MSGKVYVYVGTWGADLHDEQNSRVANGGIHVFSFDERDGNLTHLSNIAGDVNAGILCISPDRRFLYSVNERKDIDGRKGNGGGVYSFAIEPETGSLRFINRALSMGAYPCFITIDGTGSYVFVCNHGHHTDVVTRVIVNEGKFEVKVQYDEGSVAMFPTREDGGLGEPCDVKLLAGTSIDPFFQASSHPHSVNVDPTGQFVIVCDKGADRIVTYRIDHSDGKLAPTLPPYITTDPGTGPRHLAFHPSLRYLFVCNETNSSVNSYSFDIQTGNLGFINNLPSTPADYVPKDPSDQFARNNPADIQVHPNGKFVCVSNRGHNSIATYRIDGNGALSLVGYTPSGGEIPRALCFDPSGELLLAANQRTGNIVAFHMDGETGDLRPAGALTLISNPVCIRFVTFEEA